MPLPGQVSRSQVAKSTLPRKFCLHSWEMQRLQFPAGLSTDLDGGVLFETDFQDPLEEGEAEEPCGVFVGALKVALLNSGSSKR